MQRFSKGGADDLKTAMALFHERPLGQLDAQLVIACYTEPVVQRRENQAGEVAQFVEEPMVSDMNEALSGSDAEGTGVPVEVAVGVSWAGSGLYF
jgi:hypothetical protein